MNSPNRLLHAAARGARIEYNTFTAARPDWVATPRWLRIHHSRLRIHPDDAHLQYGLISTALREAAETGEFPYTVTGLMAETAARYEREYRVVWADDYVTFLLILAEALADEGL